MSQWDVDVIIAAAGSSRRMGSVACGSKQFTPLLGTPVLIHSLLTFCRIPRVERVVTLVRPGDVEKTKSLLKEYGFGSRVQIEVGGETRQESVWHGLQVLGDRPDRVCLVHDGARPNASSALIRRVMEAVEPGWAVAPAVPVADTIKVTTRDGVVQQTLDRKRLAAVQTPQGFPLGLLFRVHQQARAAGVTGTDDCALVERLGGQVKLVAGERSNLKVTTPEDLVVLSALMQASGLEMAGSSPKDDLRCGHGYDVHRLVHGRRLVLGGVEIPHEKGLEGHSDADVITHALMDALLGASALGDIGQHFPDTNEEYKDACSVLLLGRVAEKIGSIGWKIVNCDITCIAQRPKLARYVEEMRRRLAAVLRIGEHQVSVKATTTEGLGPFGREEGIAAAAVVLLRRCAVGSTVADPKGHGPEA